MALHPVDVAFDGVDLTVVRKHAERLSQAPLREGVGRITLVINRECRFKTCVHQVWIEFRNLLCQHHAFVDDRTAGQRTEIQRRDLCRESCFLDPTTDDVEFALELLFVDVLFTADQDLFDLRAGRVRFLTKAISFHRNVAPAVDVVTHTEHFGLNDRAATLLSAEIGARQEHLTNCDQFVHIWLVASATDLVVEEGHWNLNMDTRAVTRFAVSVDSATVPNRLERVDPVIDHFAGRFTIQRNNKPYTARRMFVFGTVEAVLRHPLALCLFGCDPVFIIDGHEASPWNSGHCRAQPSRNRSHD